MNRPNNMSKCWGLIKVKARPDQGVCYLPRSLEFLMRHLSRLATFSPITNMHTKNLAIVWAPNLLR